MAQKLTTSFITTNRPGAYFQTNIKTAPSGVGTSGNIAIIGEAEGGSDISSEAFKDNFFTPDQFDRVAAKYISGPIVDAFAALASPSNDANITGSANRIYIAKTNKGTKASASIESLSAPYATLSAKNFGVGGNQLTYSIAHVANSETSSTINGIVIPDFALLQDAQFAIYVKGEKTIVDAFTGVPADFDTIAKVVALLSTAIPSATISNEGDALVIEAITQSFSEGSASSIELEEVVVGDLAKLGLEAQVVEDKTSSVIQLEIKNQASGQIETFVVESSIALSIGAESDLAELSIQNGKLITSATGLASLDITLSDYVSLSTLAEYINAQAGYSVVVAPKFVNLPTSILDEVVSVGIASPTSEVTSIKTSVYALKRAFTSALADISVVAKSGFPEEKSLGFFTSGTKGGTKALDAINAINACENVNVNFVLPLFSRNASEDIVEGLTDASSTYTISAINAATKSHVLKMSTAKVKKHRSCALSIWTTFNDAQAQAQSLSNARVSLAIQKASQVNSQGVVVSHLPWFTACIAIGMQAAGFYKAIVAKYANVISFEDPSGMDSGNSGDIETALDAGLLILEQTLVGNKWVSDQTTYGKDENFVYNSIQAMYAADLVALDLAASFDNAFTGQSLADVDASTALSFLASKMDQYKKQKLIVASDGAPLGYKNAKININGPILEVYVEIVLGTAIYFIPISIDISQASSAA